MRPLLLLALLAVLCMQGCSDAGSASPGTTASGAQVGPTFSRSPLPRDLCANLGTDCTLEAGHYLAQLFQPNVSFDLGEGWINNVYSARAMQILHGETSGLSFISGELKPRQGSLGTTARDLLTYLAGQPGLTAKPIETITLGGQPAVALDVTVGADPVVLFDRPISSQQSDPFEISPTEHARFVAADVGGERLLIVIEALPPVDLATFMAEQAQPVLDSLAFPAPDAS